MINEGEPTGIESTEPKRTRESEIKANLEFWKGTKWELSESEVRKAIEEVPEVEGFNWYIVIPKGIKTSEIFELVKERHPSYDDIKDFDKITMPENSDETYAIATKFKQEPDEDSLGEHARSAEDWEKTNDQFMNLAIRLVAGMRYFRETHQHLDKENITICPHSRSERGRVPLVSIYEGTVNVVDLYTDVRHPRDGVRKVITKDSKVSQ